MFRMFKAEMLKLLKSRAFKVLCVIALFLSVLLIVMPLTMTEEIMRESLVNTMPPEQIDLFIESFVEQSASNNVVVAGQLGFHTNGAKDPFNVLPLEVFHMAFGSGVIEILISVLVGTMVAREYSEGTLKNTLAYGRKRSSFYIAKFFALLLGTTILLSIMTLLSTAGVTVLKGWGQPFELAHLGEMGLVFGGTLVIYSAVIALMMLGATLVKSNGATIGLGVGLFIGVPTIAAFSYGRYDWYDALYELTLFYNSTAITSLASTSEQVVRAIFIGVVTFVLAFTAGLMIFKRQDIK